jgi:hypothetical protein
LALFALTGMSGSGSPVKAAIAASPFSYYHFRAAAWWGRPVTISIRSLHVTGSTATAVVVASAVGKKLESQQVSLTRTNGSWALVTPLVDEPFGTITGPLATREPTAQEQAAISAAGFKVLKGEQDCVRFVVAVSAIDPGFASARLSFFGPRKARCASNGMLLFARSASGAWSYHGAGSDPFSCTWAPAGVIRSLFGSCFIVAD